VADAKVNVRVGLSRRSTSVARRYLMRRVVVMLREVLIILLMVVLGALAYGFVIAAERM
jgi:hypothetical protein